MRKEDVTSLFVYMIIIAIAMVYGLVFLQPYYAESNFTSVGLYALFILGSIVAGIVANAVLLELGHLAGAKLGKYKVLSFNILHFGVRRNEEDKMKFGFFDYDGLTGEVKILPLGEDSNPRHYLTLGTLFSSLLIGGCLAGFLLLGKYDGTLKDMSRFFLTAGVVSLVVLLYNILPLRLDTINDGYRLLMVSNPKNREAFNELLKVEYAISQGHNDVEIKTFTDLTNFTAELNMNKIRMLIDNKKFAEANELLDLLLSKKDDVSNKVYLETIVQKIYVLKNLNNDEEFLAYIEKNIDLELRKVIADNKRLSSIRAYLIIEGFYDNSKNECLYALAKVERAYKHVEKKRRSVELVQFNEVIDMIDAAHPKWGIGQYKLVDANKKEA